MYSSYSLHLKVVKLYSSYKICEILAIASAEA